MLPIASLIFAISVGTGSFAALIGDKFYVSTPSEKSIEAIQDGVRKSLNDPDSAKFGQIFESKSSNTSTKTVCGFVNARNRFGGYVGMVPFYGLLLTMDDGSLKFIVIGEISATPISAKVTASMCKEKGINL